MFSAEVLAAADDKRKRPRAIFIFAGPPGVGKTFLAEQASESLDIPFKRLETDTHPQTGKPFFPTAICSRLATGYPMMFNHLQAHDLEKISAGESQRFCKLFEKQYNIRVEADALLSTVLLLAEGGQADARTLRAQTELFFKVAGRSF